MTLCIELRAPSLPQEAVDIFVQESRLVFRVLGYVRRSARLPSSRLVAILADDFVGEVERWTTLPHPMEGPRFNPERSFGRTVAKSLRQTSDSAHVVLVFGSSYWRDVLNPERHLTMRAALAHEFTHPILDRARSASGALATEPSPPVTGREQAREIARSVCDEYRCERMAGIFIGLTTSVEINGTTHPGSPWYVTGPGWMDALRGVIGAAHPLWPDTVQRYREREIELMRMFVDVASSVAATLEAVARARAEADSADEQVDIFDDASIAMLPATRLYLREPWLAFLATLRTEPLLPSLLAFPAAEERMVSSGEAAIVDIWSRLGLTLVDHPNREWGLLVGEPTR
jgi:hypothetical protein